MTINEAAKKGIGVLRDPNWNQYAHMKIDLVEGGLYGPWGHIVDPPGNLATGNQAETATHLLIVPSTGLDPNEDGWEEWKQPDDYDRFLTAEPIKR